MLGRSKTNKAIKILLVDDRPENLMAMEAVLEPFDYDIRKAQSGWEALKFLLSEDFALIVLDIRMPGMDGFETAEIIRGRERTRYIPILFVTANRADEIDLIRAHMAGGTDYIAQPLRPDVLAKKVQLIIKQMYRPAPSSNPPAITTLEASATGAGRDSVS